MGDTLRVDRSALYEAAAMLKQVGGSVIDGAAMSPPAISADAAGMHEGGCGRHRRRVCRVVGVVGRRRANDRAPRVGRAGGGRGVPRYRSWRRRRAPSRDECAGVHGRARRVAGRGIDPRTARRRSALRAHPCSRGPGVAWWGAPPVVGAGVGGVRSIGVVAGHPGVYGLRQPRARRGNDPRRVRTGRRRARRTSPPSPGSPATPTQGEVGVWGL